MVDNDVQHQTTVEPDSKEDCLATWGWFAKLDSASKVVYECVFVLERGTHNCNTERGDCGSVILYSRHPAPFNQRKYYATMMHLYSTTHGDVVYNGGCFIDGSAVAGMTDLDDESADVGELKPAVDYVQMVFLAYLHIRLGSLPQTNCQDGSELMCSRFLYCKAKARVENYAGQFDKQAFNVAVNYANSGLLERPKNQNLLDPVYAGQWQIDAEYTGRVAGKQLRSMRFVDVEASDAAAVSGNPFVYYFLLFALSFYTVWKFYSLSRRQGYFSVVLNSVFGVLLAFVSFAFAMFVRAHCPNFFRLSVSFFLLVNICYLSSSNSARLFYFYMDVLYSLLFVYFRHFAYVRGFLSSLGCVSDVICICFYYGAPSPVHTMIWLYFSQEAWSPYGPDFHSQMNVAYGVFVFLLYSVFFFAFLFDFVYRVCVRNANVVPESRTDDVAAVRECCRLLMSVVRSLKNADHYAKEMTKLAKANVTADATDGIHEGETYDDFPRKAAEAYCMVGTRALQTWRHEANAETVSVKYSGVEVGRVVPASMTLPCFRTVYENRGMKLIVPNSTSGSMATAALNYANDKNLLGGVESQRRQTVGFRPLN